MMTLKRFALLAVLLSSLIMPMTVHAGRGMNWCWFDQWLAWALGHGGELHCTGNEY